MPYNWGFQTIWQYAGAAHRSAALRRNLVREQQALAYGGHAADAFIGEVSIQRDALGLSPTGLWPQINDGDRDASLPIASAAFSPTLCQASRERLVEFFAKWPEDVRDSLAEHHLVSWRTAWREDGNLYDEVSDELRRAPGLPDVPLIVISAMGPDAAQSYLWPEEVLREIKDAKRAVHTELAASVPSGEHRVIDDAGHGWMHEERPDAVLQAIIDLLHRARGRLAF
jgi:hypothetical protein